MQINFFNAKALRNRARATVYSSGRLSFSHLAEQELSLAKGKAVRIGLSENSDRDTDLYLLVTDKRSPDAFSVFKGGTYYYANTKVLFDRMGVDYLKSKIVYDIEQQDVDGQKLYKLKRLNTERRAEIENG